MTSITLLLPPRRHGLVVKAPTLNIFRYLYRSARAVRHVPGLSKLFLFQLYQQTILGWWWLIIRALLPTIGIIAIFQHVPAFKPTGLPYGLYVISGMVLWTTVSATLLRGTRALVRTQKLFSKLAVPKLVFILASGAVSAVFSSIFAVVLLVGLLLEYLTSGTFYLKFDWPLLLFPIPIVIAFLLCIGICCFAAVAFLFARDARYIVALFTQLWFYFTPIIYTLDIMPPNWQLAISYLNPMASLMDFFRWSLFGVGDFDAVTLATAILVSLAVFLLGARFLMRCELVLSEVL